MPPFNASSEEGVCLCLFVCVRFYSFFLFSPLPTASDIVWSYPSDTHLLLQNNAVIYIRSASLADAGQYSCSVTGLAIYSASLTVLGKSLSLLSLSLSLSHIQHFLPQLYL